MKKDKESVIRNILEPITPDFIRLIVKRLYWIIVRVYNKKAYIKKGRRADLGHKFRFSRSKPYVATIGEGTVTEEFNVWNAKRGDITVGKRCWFGLHNIVMGPVEIGDPLREVVQYPETGLIGTELDRAHQARHQEAGDAFEDPVDPSGDRREQVEEQDVVQR